MNTLSLVFAIVALAVNVHAIAALILAARRPAASDKRALAARCAYALVGLSAVCVAATVSDAVRPPSGPPGSPSARERDASSVKALAIYDVQVSLACVAFPALAWFWLRHRARSAEGGAR